METLDQIITKVSPFADSVEGDKIQFLAEGKVVVSFQICQNDNGWRLKPNMTGYVDSFGPSRDAMVRAKLFCKAFKEVAA
jgi:hypothetical protein